MSNTYEIFGEPVQLLKINPANRRYELDTGKLERIFLQEHLQNVELSVVSIAGAFRRGKSFMLSFFLRYLNVWYNDKAAVNPCDDWLGDVSARLSGFAWRGGSERHTTGIWIWSQIFTKTMPNGKRIGIVLMDTQGTFDNENSMDNNVTIFALSTMLSSIQIYNLFNNIQEDDLQHLQLFAEYGRIAANANESDSKPFQQLMFLIRDWNFPYEHNYGIIGGTRKLEKILEISNTQSPENQALRKYLRSCFDEIQCFLMPHPGEETRNNVDFDGKLSLLAPKFIEKLKEFVPYLLKPSNVERSGLKKVHGNPLTPASFCNLVQQYWEVFKSGKMPEANNILTATTVSVCLSAKNEATQLYYKLMSFYAETDDVDVPQVINIHKNLSKEAIKLYNKKAIIGDAEIRHRYEQELINFLQDNVLYFIGMNQSRRSKSLEDAVERMAQEIQMLRARDKLVIELQTQLKTYMLANRVMQEEYLKQIKDNVADTVGKFAVVPKRESSWCSIM